MQDSLLRHVPNAISAARLACAPVLIGLAYAGHQQVFAWLLIAAFVSDAVDGLIARSAGVTSKTGARLDSLADLSVQVSILFGLWLFFEPFVRANAPIFAGVIGLWLADIGFGLWRYGRVASFHTYASRVAAYVLALFLALLFLVGVQMWLFYLTFAFIAASLVEGLVLIALIPRWRTDVKGLYWVLKAESRDG